MAAIQANPVDETAKAAKEVGLLTPQTLAQLVTEAVRRGHAAGSMLSIADRVAAAGIRPMSIVEINAELKRVRAQRRRSVGGS